MGCGRNPNHVRHQLGAGLVVSMPSTSRILTLRLGIVGVRSTKQPGVTGLFPLTEELLGCRNGKIKSHKTGPDRGNLHRLITRDSKGLKRTIVGPGSAGPSIARKIDPACGDLRKKGFDGLLELEDAVTPEDIPISHRSNFLDRIDFECVRILGMGGASDLRDV